MADDQKHMTGRWGELKTDGEIGGNGDKESFDFKFQISN
jgi:hypothetical protein